MNNEFGYCEKIKKFLDVDEDGFIKKLSAHHKRVHGEAPGEGQVNAWKNAREVLIASLNETTKLRDASIIFECAVPSSYYHEFDLQYAKWADVVILCNDIVMVLEFKQRKNPIKQFCRQVKGYENKFRRMHIGSVGLRKKKILVMTHANGLNVSMLHVKCCSPDALREVLEEYCTGSGKPTVPTKAWMSSGWSLEADKQMKWREWKEKIRGVY